MIFVANKISFEAMAKAMVKAINTSKRKYLSNHFLCFAFVENGALIASDGRQMIGIKQEFLHGIGDAELKEGTAYNLNVMKWNKCHIAIQLEEVENINVRDIDNVINFNGFEYGATNELNSFLAANYRLGCFDLNHLLTAFEVVKAGGGANAVFSKNRQFKVENEFAFFTCVSMVENNPVFEPQEFVELKAI